MAKSVFYSFHYERDVHRVQLVRNIDALEGQRILNGQDWEAVRRRGHQAIRNWINEQMEDKEAVIVLIGAKTAKRPWVQYEIEHAWKIKKPLLGISIHGLASFSDGADEEGPSPFNGYIPRIPVFDPTVRRLGKIDTNATYKKLKDNLLDWLREGVTRW